MRIGDREIKGLLIDLDGVLYVGNQAIPGAIEAMRQLQTVGLPRCYVTNTTTKSIESLRKKLCDLGFAVDETQIFSAPEAAKLYLKSIGSPVSKLVLNPEVLAEFANVPQSDLHAKAVVLGDIGKAWTYDLLNTVFRLAMDGAELIALHRNKYWETESGLQMDIGAFVAGLEYVTGKTATIIGKPSPPFFGAALSRLRLQRQDVAMIGDDIATDVAPAQAFGMVGILVKTGKYRQALAEASGIKPDVTLDSIAQLVSLL